MTSPFDLTGRTALVTGGGRGIGRGITLGLLRAGADVIVGARTRPDDQLFEAAERVGREVHWLRADLAAPAGATELARAAEAHRPVDVLVANAGTQERFPAAVFPTEAFDRVLQVNLRSVFELCRDIGAAMLSRGSGRIVTVASLLSFQGGLTVPAYAASKGAVLQLTKALCNEWAGRGVNVNAVVPGYMDTEMNTTLLADPVRRRQIDDRIPAGRWGTPDDIAGAVVYLASPAAAYVHGVALPVDGGWLAR
ncbi:SDR family oxidoreductase [Nakamurella leprariae]|uniref:SDR family oxidoreductase n=1 Tax=Nakamurella leprariae TaxID=2803911 RepID=A0A938YIP3_9ACTN|nr:SDR family oxidoreductase [Nakamurella leprariae]MBM9468573.1 SDR family oxidoreductase [Nakamurella leprariae]